jgi:hypothetical protein
MERSENACKDDSLLNEMGEANLLQRKKRVCEGEGVQRSHDDFRCEFLPSRGCCVER